jgi:polysaccharide deacetylase family protein (PEP-CTERM system associated)
VIHHFSVDVEDYFNYLGFERRVPLSRWDSLESRVEPNVYALLEALAEVGATGTFFTLGWIAERHPEMVRAIVREGHEMASHGYSHRRVCELSPGEFRDEIRTTTRILEDLTGEPVKGFRAPHFSLVAGSEWALDVLIEEGYEYDSSLFPIWRPGYGYAGGGRDPHWLERPGGWLAEVPPATLRLAGVNLPAAGGAWFRVFPYGLVRRALLECETRGVPGTFYIHPWELDPGQPTLLQAPRVDRLKHETGLKRVAARLRRLLGEFRFGPIARTVAALPPRDSRTFAKRPGSATGP